MWALDESLLFCVALVVHLMGVLSVAIARVSERRCAQVRYQRFFLTCLLLVGLISVLAVSSGNGCWVICATTLPIMAVGATLDLRPLSTEKSSVA